MDLDCCANDSPGYLINLQLCDLRDLRCKSRPSQHLFQLGWIAGELDCVFVGDFFVLIELLQRLVHGVHAEVLALADGGVELASLALFDGLADGGRVGHDFDSRQAAVAVCALHKTLRGDAEERGRELDGYLPAEVDWEAVDDAVHGRGGGYGVEGGD